MSSIHLTLKKDKSYSSNQKGAVEPGPSSTCANDDSSSSLPRLDRLMEGEFSVEASDLVRLIMGFLTAQGLHESARVLRKESGVGFVNGVIRRPMVASAIRHGDWGSVMKATFLLGDITEDNESEHSPQRRIQGVGDSIQGRISEQIILELAEEDKNLNLAYSLLRVHRDDLDRIIDDEASEVIDVEKSAPEVKEREKKSSKSTTLKASRQLSKARSLEQKLAEIAANPSKFANNNKERSLALYGSQRSKQDRREDLARMVESQLEIPINRLPTLIQQAMKWQSHTGQLPWIKEICDKKNGQKNETSDERKKRRKRKRYDLVLGKVAGDPNILVGDQTGEGSDDFDFEEDMAEVPKDILSKVKFGKSAVCESALFFTRGLITGSSDSMIEIWDEKCSYKDLNTTDFPYQKDHVMGHTDASILCMAVSNDGDILVSGDSIGKVKVWNLASGKCLRQYQAHDTSVTALSLSRDASRVLTGCASGICREFGIVTQTVLQVFEGHTSYIHSCNYALDWIFAEDKKPHTAIAEAWVVTSSADGTVRVWNNGLCTRILQPPSEYHRSIHHKGKLLSLVVDPTAIRTESPAIHSVFQIPGEEARMLVVPRSSTAFLIDLEGEVLQLFSTETSEAVFLAATVTSATAYLVSSTGNCLLFSLRTGKLLQSIHDFSLDSTAKTGNDSRVAELSGMIHHPFKPSILAAFSNDKTQKKGMLTVWK